MTNRCSHSSPPSVGPRCLCNSCNVLLPVRVRPVIPVPPETARLDRHRALLPSNTKPSVAALALASARDRLFHACIFYLFRNYFSETQCSNSQDVTPNFVRILCTETGSFCTSIKRRRRFCGGEGVQCTCYNSTIRFYARQRSYSAYMPWQFRLSVCLSHGRISQKRLKLGSRNFHHTVAPSL